MHAVAFTVGLAVGVGIAIVWATLTVIGPD